MTRTLAFRIAAALLAIGIIVLTLSQCTSLFTAKQAARTAKGQAEASIDSGAEAMNTVSNVSAGDDRIDETVKGGRDEILSQPAGRSNDAALRAACRLRQYRDLERCAALRGADPGNAAGGRPRR